MGDGHQRFLHVALASEGRACPVAHRGGLRRAAADIVEGDCADELIILAANEKERQGGVGGDGALGPVDTVREGAAREVILGPGGLPWREEFLAVAAQPCPWVEVGMCGRAQDETL